MESRNLMDLMSPQSLINQLASAAGMNFVSALRELIDNSLDADAKSIAIRYANGEFGIEDDGRGADDPGVIVAPNVHAEHTTTRSGRYGIGGSTALAWMAEGHGAAQVKTTTTAERHILEMDYSTAAAKGELNCKQTKAPNRSGQTGTTIVIRGTRRLSAQHVGCARRELSETYAPALRSGVSIAINGTPLLPFAAPATAKQKKFKFDIDGHPVKGFVGLVKPGEPNRLMGWTIAYGHRFVCTKSDPAVDHDIDIKRIYSEVELPRSWPWINTHKDEFTEPQVALMAKLTEVSLWAIEQAKSEGRSIELTGAIQSAQAILDAALGVPGIKGKRPGPRGKDRGTKEPTGTGSEHEHFNATQPGDRKARAGPRRIKIQYTSGMEKPYKIELGVKNTVFVTLDQEDEGNRKYMKQEAGGYLADLVLAWIAGDWVCRAHMYKPMFPEFEVDEIPEIFGSLRARAKKETVAA